MTRKWIVVGDTTSSGGQVVTGWPMTNINGRAVARVSDTATCPRHKGTFPIISGDPTLVVGGKPVALDGSPLACGCTVIAGQQIMVYVDAGRSSGSPTAQPWDDRVAPNRHGHRGPSAEQTEAADEAFDEQLQIVGATGVPLSGIDYRLELEDGTTVSGVTDSDGCTGRVATLVAQSILRAELFPPSETQDCCAAASLPSQSVALELEDVATNSTDVGRSRRRVSPGRHADRALTPGEIALLRPLFRDSVNYDTVKVHNHGYWMLFGFQPENTATAPNGQIYLPGTLFKADFATTETINQALFVHEFVHVWQHQLGYPVKRVRGVRPNMAYDYTLLPEKRLSDFNMEAQGNIIADYFLLKFRNAPTDLYEGKYSFMEDDVLPLYERCLERFLADPSDRTNLPAVTR